MKTRLTTEYLRKWIALYIAGVSMILVPVFIPKDGYLHLVGAKAHFYLLLALPAAALAVFTEIYFFLTGRRKAEKRPGNSARKYPVISLLLTAIALWSLLSTLFSFAVKASLLGTGGWAMGSLMLVTLIFFTNYLFLYFRASEKMFRAVMAVNAVLFLFAAIQMAGMDPFGLLAPLGKTFKRSYLSTIGQKNCFSGYLCLILPLFWGRFALVPVSGRKKPALYAAFCALGFLAVLAADSDSTYAGIGVGALAMLPFFLHSNVRTARAGQLLILFAACLFLVRTAPVFSRKAAAAKDLSAAMLKLPSIAGVLACGVFLIVFSRKWAAHKKLLLIILEAAVVLVIIAAVIYTMPRFNDSWGTNRGYIWRVGWEQFLQFSPKEKLIGIGPELLSFVYVELRMQLNRNVVSAHCEPLHVLLTQGIIGFVLYAGFWIYIVRLFVKDRMWERGEGVFFFPLAVYFGQSLFCSVYPVTAVVFSVMTGLYLSHTSESGTKNIETSNQLFIQTQSGGGNG